MNIEIIASQFETRAATLLRYYTGLLESSRDNHFAFKIYNDPFDICLLYTSPSPRDVEESRMPSSA